MVAAKNWVAEAEAILREETVRVLRDVRLRSRTSLGVGGPARFVVVAAGAEDLARVMSRFAQAGVPFDFLGAGSNLLVADEGPSFVVLSSEALDAPPQIVRETVSVGAGRPVPEPGKRLAAPGASGGEVARGHPPRRG